MQNKDEILCALAAYIKNEQDGFEFYEYCAQKTANENGKQMFQSLAHDELQHIARLQGEYDSLLNRGEWLTVQQAAACALPDTKALFPKDRAKIDELIKGASSDLDALQLAIEMEKDSYRAYKSEAEKASNQDAKAVFEGLAQEEHNHLETLENTYTYLANTAEWFQVKEKPIFEG
jgi:rubrerythrin